MSDATNAIRIVYFGTPSFAVPTLEALAADRRFDIALVVTQPDRPAGRGRRQGPSPVKLASLQLDLPLYQLESLRTASARQPLTDAGADLFVVAAYGLIFGQRTLGLPRIAAVNLHASLLPKFRGASPIAAAIASGETRTGISLMQMDAGLDTGPVIGTIEVEIQPTDTMVSLTERLALLGADIALRLLPQFVAGTIRPQPQPSVGASLTRPLTKGDGWINWARSAVELERHVRAMWDWPRAWTTIDGNLLQVHQATLQQRPTEGEPGMLLAGPQLDIACGVGSLRLEIVQPAGGRPMTGAAYRAGRRLSAGRFGRDGEPAERPPLVAILDPDSL